MIHLQKTDSLLKNIIIEFRAFDESKATISTSSNKKSQHYLRTQFVKLQGRNFANKCLRTVFVK